MPHFISPPSSPNMPTMISKTTSHSGTDPAAEDVAALLETILSTDSAQTALDTSYALTDLLTKSTGIRGMLGHNVLPSIKKAAGDKKTGAKRESAMFILGAMSERFPREQPLSEVVFLIQDGGLFYLALDALADKGPSVKESAQYAIDELFRNLDPEAKVVALQPALLRYLSKPTGKWQGTVGAYALLGKMADEAKIGSGSRDEEAARDVLRESMGRTLKELIPVVENGMHDLKAEVAKACNKDNELAHNITSERRCCTKNSTASGTDEESLRSNSTESHSCFITNYIRRNSHISSVGNMYTFAGAVSEYTWYITRNHPANSRCR